MRFFKVFVLFVLSIFVWGCEEEPEAYLGQEQIRPLTDKEMEIVNATNHYSIGMLRDYYSKNNNLLLSPLGASLTYAMLDNGTNGTSHMTIQMDQGITPMELNKAYNMLLNLIDINDDGPSNISFNQSIWYQFDYSLPIKFETMAMAYYNADVAPINFHKERAIERINDWHKAKAGLHYNPFKIDLDEKLLITNTSCIKFCYGANEIDTDNGPIYISKGLESDYYDNAVYSVTSEDEKLSLNIVLLEGDISNTIKDFDIEALNESIQYRSSAQNVGLQKLESKLVLPLKGAKKIAIKDVRTYTAKNETLFDLPTDEILHHTNLKVTPILKGSGHDAVLAPTDFKEIHPPYIYFVQETHTGLIVAEGVELK